MKDLCRALDAEGAQARQATWRACLSVRRLEDPPEKVPTQRTFTFIARDWVEVSRRQTYLYTRLNELDTAMVRYTLTSQTALHIAVTCHRLEHRWFAPLLAGARVGRHHPARWGGRQIREFFFEQAGVTQAQRRQR